MSRSLTHSHLSHAPQHNKLHWLDCWHLANAAAALGLCMEVKVNSISRNLIDQWRSWSRSAHAMRFFASTCYYYCLCLAPLLVIVNVMAKKDGRTNADGADADGADADGGMDGWMDGWMGVMCGRITDEDPRARPTATRPRQRRHQHSFGWDIGRLDKMSHRKWREVSNS